jgi:two-component system, LytTR family, response regulator
MKSTLHALLVDDEPPALQRLRQLLEANEEVEVVAMANSVIEAISVLQHQPVDVVFLDQRMPGVDGSQLLPVLPEGVEVIFTTAHSDYAVHAYEAGVHDYLLKPVQAARLSLSLERLRQRRRPSQESTEDRSAGLWVEESDDGQERRRFVAFAEILWVSAMQNYSHLQLREGSGVMLKRPLKHWEEQLPAVQFLRLDRSTIVQLSLISVCERQSRSCTLLRFGRTTEAPTLAVGSTAAMRLQQALWSGR